MWMIIGRPISKALWDNGDKGEADEALTGLLHRIEVYEKALRYIADYEMTGTERTLHIDFQGKAREALGEMEPQRLKLGKPIVFENGRWR